MRRRNYERHLEREVEWLRAQVKDLTDRLMYMAGEVQSPWVPPPPMPDSDAGDEIVEYTFNPEASFDAADAP